MDTANYRMILVLRALSKITQMQGHSGNQLICNREEFLHEGEAVKVTTVSANSMRHNMVREPGGLWLIDNYGLTGQLTKEQLRLLVSGGNNASVSGGAESLALLVAMREYLPLLGLMGAGLPDGPKPGVLTMGSAVPLCNETRSYCETIAEGAIELPDYLRPARLCVGKWTHYRHDPVQRMPQMLGVEEGDHDNSSMPFGGEGIFPGTVLMTEIRLKGATPLELGAFLWSYRLWSSAGGYLGGMSASGNGRTEAMLYFDSDDEADLDAIADEYAEYAMSVRDEARQWLNDVFASGKKKGKKAVA